MGRLDPLSAALDPLQALLEKLSSHRPPRLIHLEVKEHARSAAWRSFLASLRANNLAPTADDLDERVADLSGRLGRFDYGLGLLEAEVRSQPVRPEDGYLGWYGAILTACRTDKERERLELHMSALDDCEEAARELLLQLCAVKLSVHTRAGRRAIALPGMDDVVGFEEAALRLKSADESRGEPAAFPGLTAAALRSGSAKASGKHGRLHAARTSGGLRLLDVEVYRLRRLEVLRMARTVADAQCERVYARADGMLGAR